MITMLPKKTESIYGDLLSNIKNLCPDLSPLRVLVDFKMAMMNALHEKFTNVEVTGCFFHFSQAIWRQLQGLGAPVINGITMTQNFRYCVVLYQLLHLSQRTR